MEILVVLFSWLLFGGAASYFAAGRGRDPFAWFLIGLLLGILGLILLFLLPPVTQTEEKKEEGEELVIESPIKESEVMKEWFYLDEKRNQEGPFSFRLLRKLWDQGKVTASTLVWSEGMDGWKTVEEIPELKERLE